MRPSRKWKQNFFSFSFNNFFFPPFSYNSFFTSSQEAKSSNKDQLFFPDFQRPSRAPRLPETPLNFWNARLVGESFTFQRVASPRVVLVRARSHHSGQPSGQRCHDSRVLCQTDAFDLFVCSLKSHKGAGSPGLLRCSNRSPLLQEAPLDRWLMGAGVEAQVLSETPAEVDEDDLRGWIQVQHFILRGCPLGLSAAPPDWPQSRTFRGCRSALIGPRRLPSALTSRGQLVVSQVFPQVHNF